MVDKLKQQLGQPYVGEFVTLFILDTTVLGGYIYYFTPSSATPITYNSNVYTPMPISIEGQDRILESAPGRPVLSVDNISKMLMAAMLSLGDLIGAEITVIRTMSNFLDGMPDADVTEHLPILRYTIIQKQAFSRTAIKFVLATQLDRPLSMLPKRQCLKNDQNTQGSLYCPGMSLTKY